MISFLLLILGLLLILFEFYLPGAVMGILGGLAILFSIISFAQTHTLLAVFLFILLAVVSVGLLIRFALWRIVHAKPENSIYLSSDQEGYQASSFDSTAIGKTGIVLSDLKPGGYILIDGKQHQAISITGYIPKDASVIVVSGQEESLIVKNQVT
jgi:membrane-bound serine protease (ClpP class)